MLNFVDLVMFAIQAAIKLGHKMQQVFEDETRDRDLILPPVEGTDMPFWDVTEAFFAGEGKPFVQAPEPFIPEGEESKTLPSQGLYCEWWQERNEGNVYRDKLREAHHRILEGLEEYRTADDVQGIFRRPEKFYEGANALFVVKQWRDGTDPKRHSVQRIAGTVVEIALDYVKADPTLFSGNGAGVRVTRAFLLSLEKVQFAEAEFDKLLLDILQASLQTFRVHADLVISEDRLALLLKQISTTLSEEIKEVQDSGDDDKLRALYTLRREMLQDIIRVSAKTVSENQECLVGTQKSREEKLLASVLKAVLKTVQKESNLFTQRAVVDIYAAGLRAVAQNAALLLPSTNGNQHEIFLENLFTGIANQLAVSAEGEPPGIFTPGVLGDVIESALDVLATNAARLIDPKNPQEQLLVDALERVILALSSDFHEEAELSVILAGLFSRQQLVDIIQEVFIAVARNPDGLLRGTDDDPKRSALAQIIGAVAATISSDTGRLLNGDDCVELFAVGLRAFAMNPDRLLDLHTADPVENVIAQVITSVVQAAAKNLEAGGRNLLNGEVLVEMIEIALAMVSKNVDGFLKEPEIVFMVVERLLKAASNLMANELDAESLILVFPLVLRNALLGREALDVSDADLVLPALSANA